MSDALLKDCEKLLSQDTIDLDAAKLLAARIRTALSVRNTAAVQEFHAFSHGEPAAGIPALSATVYLPMPEGDPEYLDHVQCILEDAFANIWDDRNTTVLTDKEVAEDEDV